MTTEIIILSVCILLSGFFSGAEVALLSVSLVRSRLLKKQRRPGAESLYRLKQHPRRMIITILIGNNVVNIVAASLATYIASEKLGSTGVGIVTGVLTLVILIIGEITPKTFAQGYATRIALAISRPIEVMQKILSPVVYLLDKQTHLIEKWVDLKKAEPISDAEIKEMVAFGVENKVVHRQERYIIDRALNLADISVKDIMIPIKNSFTLNANDSIETALPKIVTNGFSRIPLYKNAKNNIIGLVLAKDILNEFLKKHGSFTLEHILLKPIFVKEEMKIHSLLKYFQEKSIHLAIVKNKNSAVVGIVTLEDLLEELVGEIEDELDIREEI